MAAVVLAVGCSNPNPTGIDAGSASDIVSGDLAVDASGGLLDASDAFDALVHPDVPGDLARVDSTPDASALSDTPDAAVVRRPPPALRLLAPLSGMRVTSQQPRLRWTTTPDVARVTVTVCQDRACTRPLTHWDAVGTGAAPDAPLPPGVAFWHAEWFDAAGHSLASSPTWEFGVGHRSAPHDTAYGHLHDFDGDGFDDLVVRVDTLGAGTEDMVISYQGARDGALSVARTLISAMASYAIDDFDGDGFTDLLGGAPGGVGGDPGSVFLYLGSAAGLGRVPSGTYTATDHRTWDYGRVMGAAGDLNGDGFPDAVMGPYCGDPFGVFQCRDGHLMEIHLGGVSGIDPAPNTRLSSLSVESPLNIATGVGDVNGDGYADIAIGDGFESAGSSGNVLLLLGGVDGASASPDRVFRIPGETLGISIAPPVDIDADGLDDLIISSGNAIWIYPGRPSVSAMMPDFVIRSPTVTASPPFGIDLAVGDVNADGLPDLVVDAPCSNYRDHGGGVYGCDSSFVYVYQNAVGALTSMPSTNLSVGHSFRDEVVSIDVNGDGFSDVLGSAGGQVYLFQGGPTGESPTASFTIGKTCTCAFGAWIAGMVTPRHLKFRGGARGEMS